MSANPIDDQIEAAVAHTGRIAADIFASGSKVDDPRGWVQQVADDFAAAYLVDLRGCGHLESPQPVFGAASQMGALWCLRCFYPRFTEAMWSTCDRCGRISPEGEAAVSAVTMGAVILVLCLCPPCQATVTAEQQKDDPETRR
ncbi:hypothetical protein ACFYUK_18805 [Nonomuraea wenchangensis]